MAEGAITIDYRVRRRWLRWEAEITTTRAEPCGHGGYTRTILGPSWRKDEVAQRARRWVATLAKSYREMGCDVRSSAEFAREVGRG